LTSVPLARVFNVFDLIARINLARSGEDSRVDVELEGKSAYDRIFDGIFENMKFEELRSRLELHYGEGHLAQTYYTIY